MTTKRKWTIVITAALAVIVVIVAVILGLSMSKRNLYNENIAMGNKYLAAGDYESAILSFQKAVDIDPEQESGYEGLIRVYNAQGDYTMAQSVLDRASRYNLRLAVTVESFADGGQNGDEEKSAGALSLNSGLLSTIASSSYNDYRVRNGIESSSVQSDGSISVRVSGIPGQLVFRNSNQQKDAIDVVLKKVNTSSVPAEVVLDSVGILLGKETVQYHELQNLSVYDLKAENGSVSFTAHDCDVTISCDASGNIASGAICRIVPHAALQEEKTEGETTVSGTIVNAQTGIAVSSVEMNVREGNSHTGTVMKSIKTDVYGRYSLKLNGGSYTVELKCQGYTTEFVEIYVGTYQNTLTKNFTISPELMAGEIRIVLEWSDYPRDLDSYLIGTSGNGSDVFVNFITPTCQQSGNTIADLDVDDIDGYGPETITIHDTSGSYEFYVIDYGRTGALAASGAVVKIYIPGQDVQTIRISDCIDLSSSANNCWRVVTIESGTVSVLNQIQNTDASHPSA